MFSITYVKHFVFSYGLAMFDSCIQVKENIGFSKGNSNFWWFHHILGCFKKRHLNSILFYRLTQEFKTKVKCMCNSSVSAIPILLEKCTITRGCNNACQKETAIFDKCFRHSTKRFFYRSVKWAMWFVNKKLYTITDTIWKPWKLTVNRNRRWCFLQKFHKCRRYRNEGKICSSWWDHIYRLL